MIHELKILPEYFEKVKDKKKTFEIRKNDRDFKVGDTLLLREHDQKKYTGREITRKIIYVLGDKSGYVLDGYVVMSIR
jgi:ASC-1-like (ASCH) protein